MFHFDAERIVDKARVERMTSTMVHRGPDGAGCFVSGNVGLGHRRLAIIDLSTGDQPMFSADRSIALVFNGEVYNYLELKKQLESLGHRFVTSSDTEVVLKSYEHWGVACQERFNGMWAFALWDARQRLLFLSRDRLGEKPLHYSLRDASLIFGSEIKSILASGLTFEAATELQEIYLSLGYVPAPHTFYRGISKLMPGHYLVAKDGQVTDRAYWTLPDFADDDMRHDADRICEEFDECFADSVRLRMRSDVPFGAFLSGGLDSASVVAAMSRESVLPVETLTIGFSEEAFDERRLARKVAEHFHTNHLEEVVEPNTFDESLAAIGRQFDEPFGDASAVLVGLVSRLARQRVKMVLTGDGGDELLAGYSSFVAERVIERYRAVPGVMRYGVSRALRFLSLLVRNNLRYRLNRLERFIRLSGASFHDRQVSKLSEVGRGSSIRGLIPTDVRQISMEDFLSQALAKCRLKDPFYRLTYLSLTMSLPDDHLAKVDRMSMAHSLEARVPLLDHRLVELTYQAAKAVKMPGRSTKSILKRTYGSRLPSVLTSTQKMAFRVPFREWFKRQEFDEKLNELATTDFGLNQSAVREIVRANRDREHDLGDFLWRLFVLKQWKTSLV